MGTDAERACHDLLVRLAGRLPDQLLWRLRDWLAAGALDTVSVLLPRELMRHRIGLTDDERDLLCEAAGSWGPARRLLDAVLPVPGPAEPTPAFDADPTPTDTTALSLLAVVRGHPGCRELALARRADGQRVVLVRGGERPWAAAATLQRVLRAQGDRTPCVEVLPDGADQPDEITHGPYHEAAAAAAVTLWRAPAEAAAS